MYSKKKTLNEKKNREKKQKKIGMLIKSYYYSRESVATAVFIIFVINLTL